MIEAKGLTKKYGGTLAVNDLSFSVRSGMVTGFLGPNGAGKSTTMRMILGLDKPSAGSATINGTPYAELREPLRHVGALLDAKAVHPNRSAARHLQWIATTNGIPRSRVDEVLGIVGLSDVASKKAGGFSLGMGQRLGLAAALLGDPHTLVLDEPVNGLDPEGIRWVRNFLRAFAAQGRSVLVSSHLLSEMALTADHLVVIGQGRLIADTPTAEFVKQHSATSARVRAVVPEELERLASALRAMGRDAQPGVDEENRPVLTVTGTTTDELGRVAFEQGIALSELTEQRASLEDAFMDITGGAVQYRTGGGEK
ncbi:MULTISPECIES: ABC transporter ATP-binding protein [unclassified Corynebacterium]|uniref:ABC transporter ATP-binding protein n=1 Tax=unclassified Corynebacterium TaxID=2624378 RepID=UPI0029C9DCD8|nr:MULTISPECIES: ABC transporter ATP-binding protein [unclassified Corynebacterium]WPF65898.1 ABC transporter ATP-binding protein [Corynebacterium sp. 22KM0430]WPF68391.1 ABC transporter ATP-binding protein [Corynebacterium sp. 21KM1197]